MELLTTIISIIAAIFIGVGGWIMTRLHMRQDNLKFRLQNHNVDTAKEYVRKAEFVHTIDEFKNEFKDGLKEVSRKLDKVFDVLNEKQDKLK